MHENFVFDAARGVGGELDVFACLKGADGLDEPDGADGNEILQIDARILKASGDVDDEAQVMLDELVAGFEVAPLRPCLNVSALLLGAEGFRKGMPRTVPGKT